MTANISAQSVTVENEPAQFLWPGGRHVAAVANVAYEGWSDGKAPGIGPAGNPLPPGAFDTNARSWGDYGADHGIHRLLRVLERARVQASVMVAAEAALTGDLAVCAASCGPGNLHLINGLFDANRSGVPVLAIAAHIPREEIGGSYFQETHPQELFRECSVYCELVSVPDQLPRILEIAMRAALQRGGVAVVVVVPGEVFLADAPEAAPPSPIRAVSPLIVPDEQSLAAAARVLNEASRVTILAGPGWTGSPKRGKASHRCTRSSSPPPSTGSPLKTRSSPPMSARRAFGRPVTCA